MEAVIVESSATAPFVVAAEKPKPQAATAAAARDSEYGNDAGARRRQRRSIFALQCSKI